MEVTLHPEMDQFVQEQVAGGSYDSPDTYVSELVSREMRRQSLGSDWLRDHLEPALKAEPSDYVEVSAADVIARNRARHGLS